MLIQEQSIHSLDLSEVPLENDEFVDTPDREVEEVIEAEDVQKQKEEVKEIESTIKPTKQEKTFSSFLDIMEIF